MVGVLVTNIPRNFSRIASHSVRQLSIEKGLNRRVIGLLAHVDAGKTTTTEHLLHLSGKIEFCGDVNRGNTVTDFQDLEIKRGITINSASVSFPWKNSQISLIDTPGHLDFSIEVQAALSLIQGGIIILDGTAGVEAQTSRLWLEMDRHEIPRLAYINKCDRHSSNFESSLDSIRSHFGVQVLPLVLPYKGDSGLDSLVNIITCEEISLLNGIEVRKALSPSHKFYDQCQETRMRVIESVSSLDDIAAEKVLKLENFDVFTVEELKSAIRRITISQAAVPVFAGSSLLGIGITELLDGIVDYLPNPLESKTQEIVKHLKNYFFARVFKVFRNPHKGIVSFAYILNGNLKKGDLIYNAVKKKTEVVKSLAEPFANEFNEKNEASAGEIITIYGLKESSLGDVICESQKAYKLVEKTLMKQFDIPKSSCLGILCGNIQVPAPVVYCYVEPTSQVEQLILQQALRDIQLEDPSIFISYEDYDIVVGGQGKLHFEVFQDKLRSNYKLDVKLTKPRISFCEILKTDVIQYHCLQKSSVSRDSIEMEISLLKSDKFTNEIVYEDLSILDVSPHRLIKAFESGIRICLSRGPNLHLPICQCKVIIHSLNLSRCRTVTFASAGASACIKKAISETKCCIAEPLMDLNIIINSTGGSDVLTIVKSDLSSKGAVSISDVHKGSRSEIHAIAPLRNLDDYFSHLLSITSGRASLSMKYSRHSPMAPNDERELYNRLTI